MYEWSRTSPITRRLIVLTLLATVSGATALGADDCVAVDEDDLPRACTLSERLGQCGYEAWQSWIQCVDPEGDGAIDVGFLDRQICNFWGAVDLASCAIEVPWGMIKA